jgi:hypothetical protein
LLPLAGAREAVMKDLSLLLLRTVAVLALIAAAPSSWAQGQGQGQGASACRFNGSGVVALPPLDPSIATQQSASVSLEVGDCNAQQSMVVTVDQGLRGNRTLQRISGPETIAYSVTTPSFANGNAGPGNNNFKAVTFNIVVQANAYADAVAGDYTDRLIVSVTP